MIKPEPVTMFLAYAHEDESLCKDLEKHLSLLQRQGLVSTWQDRQITAGTKWAQEIDEHLKSASIILLLISADFLASDYCYGVEMNRALERHEADQARVIPILLRPVDWKDAPFAHLQALPTDARAITDWRNRDKAFVDVVAGIRHVIEELPELPKPEQPKDIFANANPIKKKWRNIFANANPIKKKWRNLSATFTASLIVSALVIVLTTFALLNIISHSRNPNQPTATSTIPPQSTNSVNVLMFGYDTQRTHFNPSEHLLSPSTITSLKPHWTANIGTGIAETFFPSSPAVAHGVIYVGSWDHKLYALDTNTGKILWSAQTGDHITSSPAVVNGVVYVGSWDHKLYAFKADGCGQFACSPLWTSAPTGNSIFSSPVVDNGTVYVGSQDGKLYAYKASGCDGNKSSCNPLWSVQIGTSITSSPAVDHGVVYVGSWDHKLYALDAATHTIKWSYPTGDIVWSSPTVANGLIYSGSADKKLYALDAKTGVLKWEYTTGNAIHSSPAVAHGVVYIGSDDGQLYALNASTGKLFWKSASVEAAFFSSPTITNGLVYLSSNNRTLSIYNASGCGNSQTTCDPLWTSSRLSGPILSSPTVVNGAIYLSSQDGKLYAFHLLGAIP
jgi:outer membrane protein assembly factor BamB